MPSATPPTTASNSYDYIAVTPKGPEEIRLIKRTQEQLRPEWPSPVREPEDLCWWLVKPTEEKEPTAFIVTSDWVDDRSILIGWYGVRPGYEDSWAFLMEQVVEDSEECGLTPWVMTYALDEFATAIMMDLGFTIAQLGREYHPNFTYLWKKEI